ncbi:hypothetical protein ACLOJK_015066 [Asimina triloba]
MLRHLWERHLLNHKRPYLSSSPFFITAAKKVTHVVPNLETRGEQSVLPQVRSSLPPQESPDNIVVNTPDLPLIGPPKMLSQPELGVDVLVTRAEFHALAKMMKALQRQ